MSEPRAGRPTTTLIVSVVALALVLGLRAWTAGENGMERGAIWLLLVAAVALTTAVIWSLRRWLAR